MIFEDSVKKLLENQYCLLVEPSPAFSSCIMGVLKTVGIPADQVIVCHKFEAAMQMVEEKKPKLLITEYEIHGQLGLSLIEAQAKFFDALSRISIIVTSNTNDSAVAEAAEEEVDAFILKPFSGQTFTEKLTTVLKNKMDPSPYIRTIEEGKGYFSKKEFESAAQKFLTAKPLHQMPTLACSYLGLTYQRQGKIKNALEAYKEGRRFKPLHYKCLIGEFESLMLEKKYTEAYELVPLIRANYPITSHRLGQIFTAAVFTHHFQDMSVYYKMYLNLDKRSSILTELCSTALLTAGRYFIKKKDVARAMSAFEMAITVAAKNILFIEKIILDLLRAGFSNEAQVIMTKILPSDVGSPMHNKIDFRVDAAILPPHQVIEKGRKLVSEEQATPDIFETLIVLLAKAKKKQMAESIITQAVASYPDMRNGLYSILETHFNKD